MAVINFGSINIDHIYTVEHFVAPGETLSSSHYQSVLGGKGANQSIACAQAGVQTKHVGAVNNNDSSFVALLEQSGVDCNLVQKQSTTATGHAIIQVNHEGENAIVLFAGANHILSTEQIEHALAKATTGDWVLLQNETNAIEDIINIASAKNIPIAFNPAPMTTAIKQLPLDKIDLLFVNEIEAMQLTDTTTIEQAIANLSQNLPKTKVILTLGKKGVCFLYQSQQTLVEGFKVEAVDTTAAGDTFTGYFLARYIQNSQGIQSNQENSEITQQNVPTNALTTACAAAALCVTQQGAAPSIPSNEQVERFLKTHP